MPPATHPDRRRDLAGYPTKDRHHRGQLGSTAQTQMDIATIANANPEMPCTRPATAAPTAIPKVESSCEPISLLDQDSDAAVREKFSLGVGESWSIRAMLRRFALVP